MAAPRRLPSGREQQNRGSKSADETPEQVVELAYPCRMDERGEARLVIAHHDIGDERHQDEQREDAHDHHRLRHCIWRIDEDVAAFANVDVVRGGRTEREQEEQETGDGKSRTGRLVTDLEGRDAAKHALRSHVAGLRRRGAGRTAC